MANKLIVDQKIIASGIEYYEDLIDKPSINGVVLQGNTTLRQINTYSREQIDKLIAANSVAQVKVESVDPAVPILNTIYYIGPNSDGKYEQVIYTNELGSVRRRSLGYIDADVDMTLYQKKEDEDLETTDKTVVGAINEINTMLNSKQDIEDDSLATTAKTVPTAINELNTMYSNSMQKTSQVTNIKVVSSLPTNPDSTTIYIVTD